MTASELTERYAPSVLAPLDPQEAARAVESAVQRLVLSGARVDRLIAYSPQLQIEKPDERGAAPRRFVRVPIRDRDERQLRELTVDGDGQVVAERRSDVGYPPPTKDELERAKYLAESDERVRELIGEGEITVRVLSPAHSDRNRHVGIEFLRINRQRIDGNEKQVAVGLVRVDIDLDEEIIISIVTAAPPDPK